MRNPKLFTYNLMDILSNVISLFNPRSYITLGLSTHQHWAMYYPGVDGFKFFAIQKGNAWLRLPEWDTWQLLHTGDAVIITQGSDFYFSTDIQVPEIPVSELDYESIDGYANYGGDAVQAIAGHIAFETKIHDFLLQSFPKVIVVSTPENKEAPLNWLMQRVAFERRNGLPGSDIAQNHLIYLLVIEVLREWLEHDKTSKLGWLGGLNDPQLLPALIAIHNKPEQKWSLQALAQLCCLSRAGFAHKFHESIGVSPIKYHMTWRLSLAKSKLETGDSSVKNISIALGFTSESVFSTSFKRFFGVAPSHIRSFPRN